MRGFDRFRDFYGWLLTGILRRRVLTPLVAGSVVAGAVVLSLFVGSDFFPQVDAGLIQLHVRAPARTRIERTEQIFHAVEDNIRQQIPPQRSRPRARQYRPAGSARTTSPSPTARTIGVNDGQILIAAERRATRRPPTTSGKLRRELPTAFPDVQFYFQPADLATQVLNFGVPSQIDVQVQGRDRAANQAIAKELQQRMAAIPGIVDAHVQQELDAPELYYTIDRTRAQELGLNVSAIANNLNISLSSSEQVSPNFWTDPKNGIPYFLRGADAGIPDRQQATTSTIRRSPARSPAARRGARSARQRRHVEARARSSRSTTTPTSSRSTTSMPACRTATSAAPPRRSRTWCRRCRASSAPPTASSFAARSTA